MNAYQINEENLAEITHFNNGVTPKIEDKPSYFITDILGLEPNLIVSEDEFKNNYNIVKEEKHSYHVFIVNKK